MRPNHLTPNTVAPPGTQTFPLTSNTVTERKVSIIATSEDISKKVEGLVIVGILGNSLAQYDDHLVFLASAFRFFRPDNRGERLSLAKSQRQPI